VFNEESEEEEEEEDDGPVEEDVPQWNKNGTTFCLIK
jgi:hypothetical protein